MEIMLLLLPLSIVLVFLIGAALWWSIENGQFDDLEGPAHRILRDEDHVGAARRLDADQRVPGGDAAQSACSPGDGPRDGAFR